MGAYSRGLNLSKVSGVTGEIEVENIRVRIKGEGE